MILKYNTIQEVNEKQYNFVRNKLSSLICYLKKDGKFYIKPFLFQGQKKIIEELLMKLE